MILSVHNSSMKFRRLINILPDTDAATKASDQVVFADDNAELPSEIELLQPGSWDTPNHGSFDIGGEDIQTYVENFKAGMRKGVPINIEHDDKGGAVGWIKDVFEKGGSLWGRPEWTRAGEALLRDKAFKFISPEFSPNGYLDPETGKESNHVLIGAALTNKPLFKSLAPVVANEEGTSKLTSVSSNNIIYAEQGESKVNLEELRKKDVSALTEDEKKFLSEHKAELTAEEQTKFGLAEAAAPAAEATPATSDASAQAATTPEATAPATADAAVTDQTKNEAAPEPQKVEELVSANDKTGQVVIAANELAALKEQAAKGVLAHEQLEYKKASDQVDSWIAANDAIGSKFKVEAKDRVTKFLLNLTADQRKTFEEIVANDMHGRVLVKAGEAGTSSTNTIGSASIALQKAAEEIMASDKSITYASALKKAITANPSLAQEHEQELTPSVALVQGA